MKTLHVPYCFYPDPVGGTEVYVASLARGLQARAWPVVVAAPGPTTDRYEHEGLTVRRFGVSERPEGLAGLYGEGDAAAARAFVEILDDVRPDILHLHAFTRAASLRLVRAARARGVPIVFTYHTPTVSCQRGTLLRWGGEVCDGGLRRARCSACVLHGLGLPRGAARALALLPPLAGRAIARTGLTGDGWTALQMSALVEQRHAATRALLDEVDRVVALCRWSRDLLLVNGVSSGKVVLAPHGIARPAAHERRPPVGSDRTALRIAFFGRLDRAKGADTLIGAVRALPDRRVEADLYGLAQSDGDLGYLAELERLADGDPRIRLRSAVRQGDAMELLPAYDVLAVPSRGFETGPLVVLEAFSAGVPVVGSRLGGIAELVRDAVNGLLVEPGSVRAWASALGRLQDDRQLLDRLRAGIRPPRTVDDVVDDMQALYDELARHAVKPEKPSDRRVPV